MNPLRSILLLTAIIMLCATATGCTGDPPEHSRASAERSVEDPLHGVRLELRADHDTIGIADRIWVRADWHWPHGTRVTIVEPDWSDGDWTLIESLESPATGQGDRYVGSRQWLIEPFLPGTYSVPSPVLQIVHQQSVSELRAEPIEVAVVGVLPQGDAGILNPIAEPEVPQATEHSLPPLWIGVIAGVVLLALIVLLIARRRTEHNESDSVYAQLKRVEDDSELDNQAAYELLERALGQLGPRVRQTGEFARIFSACERARFDKHHKPSPPPSHLARQALQLLGHAPIGRPAGGEA